MPLCRFSFFTALFIRPLLRCRNRDISHATAIIELACLRIRTKITDDDDFINSAHDTVLLLMNNYSIEKMIPINDMILL